MSQRDKPQVLVIGLPRAGKTTLTRAMTAADSTCSYIDSDSEAANRILHDALPALPDAVLLAIDATDAALEQQFDQFDHFLRRSRNRRGRDVSVGGLPLFLVLTKCKPSPQADQRLKDLGSRFEQWLHFVPNRLPFGSLAVTASLAEPIAELAAACSTAATINAERRLLSGARLRILLAIFAAIALFLFAGAAILALSQSRDEDRLHTDVRWLRDHEPATTVRLAESANRLHRLRLIADHPGFEKLPADDRNFVACRITEYQAYCDFRDRIENTLGPAEVRTDAELRTLESELDGPLSPPAEYDAVWHDTDACQLYRKWKTDAALLRRCRDDLAEHYRERINTATDRLLTPTYDETWSRAVMQATSDNTDALKGQRGAISQSPILEIPRGEALMWDVIFENDLVQQAQADWHESRERLLSMHHLSSVLGLLGSPAILAFPETGASKNLAVECLKVLDAKQPQRHWNIDRFPDPGRGILRTHLQSLLRRGTQAAQAYVKEAVGAETREQWLDAAKKIEKDPDILAWGRLLREIAEWNGKRITDPVKELCEYVRMSEFVADVPLLEVFESDGTRIKPTGPLILSITSPDHVVRTVEFKHTEKLAFKPDVSAIRFRTSDVLEARLPVLVGEQQMTIVWNRGRSSLFTADRLLSEPVFQGAAIDPAISIQVRVRPPGAWPALPLLMPDFTR